jgi:anthranilate synthase component 2
MLGVCLGHQSIGAAFGGDIVRAKVQMHGKTSTITTEGKGVFAGLPSVQRDPLPLAGDRARDAAGLPGSHAWTGRRRDHGRAPPRLDPPLALEGVQFHPESILTEHGHAMLKNFLKCWHAR